IAIGVVSHRTLNAETPNEVAADIRRALQYVDIQNLLITSDCGFGRQGANRMVAFYKSAAAAQGANIVRREHSLPETYIPGADPRLLQDHVPAEFEESGASAAPAKRASVLDTPYATFSDSYARPSPSHAARFSNVIRDRR